MMRRTSLFRRCVAMTLALLLLFSGVFSTAEDTGSGASFYSEWFSLDSLMEAPEAENADDAGNADAEGDAAENTDTIVIRNPEVGVEFLHGADSVANGSGTDLVWKADTNRSGHEFAFRVNYGFSTVTDSMEMWQPEQIEIRIPLAILRDRDGNLADNYYLSIPEWDTKDLTDANPYVYKIDGDEIVIYNRLAVKPSQEGYFELSYSTSKSTYEYMDYLTEDGKIDYHSDPMSATLIIHDLKTEDGKQVVDTNPNSDLCHEESGKIQVCIDTNAKITSTQKSIYGSARDTWDTSWGTNPAAETDGTKYKYLMWKVTSVFEATQPFTYTLSDQFDPEHGELVGYLLKGDNQVLVPGQGTGEDSDGVSSENSNEVSVKIPSQNSMRESRTDYVITKIEKDYYNQLLEDNGSFEVLNEVTATVTPGDKVDAATERSDTAPYSERKSVYRAPGGYVSSGKTGLTTNYDLTLLQQGKAASGIDEISGLMYRVSLDGTTYKLTYDGAESDIEKPEGKEYFGKKLVTFSVNDQNLWLSYEDKEGKNQTSGQLTSDDYRVDSLNFSCVIRGAEYSTDELSFHSAEMSPEDIAAAVTDKKLTDLVFTIYSGKTNLGTVTYHFADKSYTVDSELSGKVTTDQYGNIRFDSSLNVTGYAAEFSTALYSSSLIITPSVTLKRSEKVKEILNNISQDDFDAELWNKANFTVTTEGNNVFYTGESDGRDYLLGDTRGSRIAKSFLSRQNDTVRSRYLIVWETSMEDYYTIRNQTYGVWQEGGTFVDLLPDGFVYVPDSMICYADDVMLQEGQYSVEIVSDQAEGEGRAKMTVTMGVPAYQYRIVYTTAATWDTVVRLRKAAGEGNTVQAHNAVAYITDNESIGPFDSDKSGTNGTDALITSDLYNEVDSQGRIISTGANAPVGALVSSSSGLDKLVRATDANSTYRKTTSVYAGSEYSYRLHFGPAIGSKADQLIVYDFLEEFPGTTWYGTFSSIDTTEASAYGANPVVYYCTLDREKIKKNENNETIYADLKATDDKGNLIWTNTRPADLSSITGIAVDMSKTKNDEDFILTGGQSISIIVYMHAPNEIVMDGESAVEKAPAYNEVYLHQRLADETEEFTGSGNVISQGHTEVYYYISGSLALKKVNQDGEPIQDIAFRLHGTSAYNNDVDMTLASRADGMVIFEKVEVGTYTLEEAGYTPDYLAIPEELTVVVDESGNCTITNDPLPTAVKAPEEGETAYTITNYPRIHGALNFTKRGRIDGQTENTNVLSGVTFRLSGVSDYGNLIDLYAESDERGTVSFPDVEKGTYDLTEISTDEHYVLLETPLTVVCDQDGMIILSGENVEQSSDGAYTVYNEPLHTLALMKVDALNGKTLGGAKFQLSGVLEDGTIVNQTQTSHESGALDFENLKAGVYLLQEIEPPEGYLASETIYTVLVEKNGRITLSWTDEDGTEHKITNTQTVEEVERIYAPGYGITGADHPASTETAFDFAYARFQMPNDREKTGVITINKEWLDTNGKKITSTDGMTAPVVHVDTTVPEAPKKKAIVSRKAWRNDIRNNNSFNDATSFKSYSMAGFSDPTQDELESDWKLISFNESPDFEGKIYVKKDTDNTLYWWSDTDEVYLPSSIKGYYKDDFNDTCDQFFINFSKIKTVDLRGFKADYVTNMHQMFYQCKKLETIIFPSNFGTQNVTTMESMFNGCESLADVNINALDTSGVKNFGYMFQNCFSLESLNLSKFETSNGTNFIQMFQNCRSMTSIDISSWDMQNANAINYFFNGCESLQTVDMHGLLIPKVTSMTDFFKSCSSLTSVNMHGCDLRSVTSLSNLLSGKNELITIDMGNCNFSSVTSMRQIVNECKKLTSLNMEGVTVTSVLTDLYYAFRHLDNLTYLDLSWLAPAHIKEMDSTFAHSYSMETIDISYIDPSYLTNFNDVFYCNEDNTKLKTIYVSEKWRDLGKNSNVSNKGNVFLKCIALEGGNGTTFMGSSGKYAIIDGGSSDPGYFTLKPAESSSDTGNNSNTEDHNGARLTSRHLASTSPFFPGMGTVRYTASSIPTDPQNSETSKNTLAATNVGEGDALSANGTQIELVTSAETYKAKTDEDTSQIYDKWIINPDGTWTYRFQTYDDELKYYVYEETISGYTWTDPRNEGYYSTIEYSRTDDTKNSVTITNKRNTQATPTPPPKTDPTSTPPPTPTPTPYTEITISKDIQLADGVVIGQDENKQFAFAINLAPKPTGILYAVKKTADGQEVKLPISFSGDSNPVVYLGKGETITIQKVPKDTTYTVTEVTDTRFETTVNGTESAVGTGSISSTDPVTLAYTNTKKENDPSGGFILEKRLGSTTISDEAFSFVINLTGLLTNTTYTWNKIDASGEIVPQTFNSGARGVASLTVSLKAGEKADFSSAVSMLPVGAKYIITERASGLVASYSVSKDPEHKDGRIARSSGANSANETALSTAQETVDEDELIQVVFTNADPSYTIRFQKYGSWDGSISSLWGADLSLYRLEKVTETNGVETYESITHLMDFTSATSPKQLALKPGEYLLRENCAPTNYAMADSLRFRIAENGYSQYWNAIERGNTIIRSDEDSWGGMASNTIMQMVDTYISPTKLRIPVQKTLNGRDMTAAEFKFRMTPISANGVRDEGNAVQISNPAASQGETATFYFEKNLTIQDYEGAVYQSSEGGKVFFFVIQEEQGSGSGVSYDKTQYIVKVLLKEENNKLFTETLFYLYGGSGSLPQDALQDLASSL